MAAVLFAALHFSAVGPDMGSCVRGTPTTSSEPAIVAACGYLNGAPLAAHTTARFIQAAPPPGGVRLEPPLVGGPAGSISGITDNLGNTWKPFTGPTPWTGGIFTLLSAIYYVNAPVTGAAHTITVHLTNPASLVVHLFAVSGSDVTEVPVCSVITHPISISVRPT